MCVIKLSAHRNVSNDIIAVERSLSISSVHILDWIKCTSDMAKCII
jgi:hypothetical protein